MNYLRCIFFENKIYFIFYIKYIIQVLKQNVKKFAKRLMPHQNNIVTKIGTMYPDQRLWRRRKKQLVLRGRSSGGPNRGHFICSKRHTNPRCCPCRDTTRWQYSDASCLIEVCSCLNLKLNLFEV